MWRHRQAAARVCPKLDAHAGFIDEVLRVDLTAPKKQRHTILRIFERLRDERGFDGGYGTGFSMRCPQLTTATS